MDCCCCKRFCLNEVIVHSHITYQLSYKTNELLLMSEWMDGWMWRVDGSIWMEEPKSGGGINEERKNEVSPAFSPSSSPTIIGWWMTNIVTHRKWANGRRTNKRTSGDDFSRRPFLGHFHPRPFFIIIYSVLASLLAVRHFIWPIFPATTAATTFGCCRHQFPHLDCSSSVANANKPKISS